MTSGNRTVRLVAAAAFAFAMIQPIAANATGSMTSNGGSFWPGYMVSLFICTGLHEGLAEQQAKREGRPNTFDDAAKAFWSCIIPPLGNWQLQQRQQ